MDWSAKAIVRDLRRGRRTARAKERAAVGSRMRTAMVLTSLAGAMFRVTMLQIKLADRQYPGPDDPMGRDWIGYDDTVSVEALFARNRGVWKLGPRADLETHAMFAYTGDQKIKFVVEIYGFERFGDRRAIIGRVLDPDDPLSRQWVGHLARGNYQNPVHYVPDEPRDSGPGHGARTPERVVDEMTTAHAAGAPIVPARSTQPRSPDPERTRLCTFPGHIGARDLPATEEYFPIRKSGARAGTFIGWCRACQKLSAQQYKAEPERQGVRSTVQAAGVASEFSARRPSSRRPSRSRRTGWIARSVSEMPESRLEWAREWFQRLDVRGEFAEYLTAVEQWRMAWKPDSVNALLVAESHVAQAEGDDRVRVHLGRLGTRVWMVWSGSEPRRSQSSPI